MEKFKIPNAVVSSSLRTGLPLIPSTSLTSSWANAMSSVTSPATRRVPTGFHNYTDVPSQDGRGIGFATANHDATNHDAINHDAMTVRATDVAALAKQGAPPRGEPR